jgi:transcriptional regulator NrdR family protein
LACGAIFTSEEQAQYGSALVVRSKKDVLRPFERDKLFLSLYNSLQHRPAARQDAGALTDTITHKLLNYVQNGVIERRTILQACLVALNRFDKAAGTHYAAFHK